MASVHAYCVVWQTRAKNGKRGEYLGNKGALSCACLCIFYLLETSILSLTKQRSNDYFMMKLNWESTSKACIQRLRVSF